MHTELQMSLLDDLSTNMYIQKKITDIVILKAKLHSTTTRIIRGAPISTPWGHYQTRMAVKCLWKELLEMLRSSHRIVTYSKALYSTVEVNNNNNNNYL